MIVSLYPLTNILGPSPWPISHPSIASLNANPHLGINGIPPTIICASTLSEGFLLGGHSACTQHANGRSSGSRKRPIQLRPVNPFRNYRHFISVILETGLSQRLRRISHTPGFSNLRVECSAHSQYSRGHCCPQSAPTRSAILHLEYYRGMEKTYPPRRAISLVTFDPSEPTLSTYHEYQPLNNHTYLLPHIYSPNLLDDHATSTQPPGETANPPYIRGSASHLPSNRGAPSPR
jgi:hypothetical protein